MRRPLLVALLICSSALSASAAGLDLFAPYLAGRYFTWEEYQGGRRLLRESGPLYAAGAVAGVTVHRVVTLRSRGEIFGGIVDYAGETQAPNPVPVDTDVDYVGTREEFDLGARVPAGAAELEPFAGLGHRFWLRGLENATSRNGQPVSGYTELWQCGYARFGLRGYWSTSPKDSLFAEGGAKYPFYVGNSVDFDNGGWTTFHPGGDWSGFGEVGLVHHRLRLSLTYEGFRFSPSPTVDVAGSTFLQPESHSDIYGVRVGWSF